jgi:hypothetical protein
MLPIFRLLTHRLEYPNRNLKIEMMAIIDRTETSQYQIPLLKIGIFLYFVSNLPQLFRKTLWL